MIRINSPKKDDSNEESSLIKMKGMEIDNQL